MNLKLASTSLSAVVSTKGAELQRLTTADGADLLWDGDPAWWPWRSPLLFPIAGKLVDGTYRLADRRFRLPQHGFARDRRFEVTVARPDRVQLTMCDDPETRAIFPFAFRLGIEYRLRDGELTIAATIDNPGAETLPFSFGFHPALRWPLPFGGSPTAHRIRFDRAEPSGVRGIGAEGLMRPDRLASPVIGRDLVVGEDVFAHGVVIFDDVKSSSLIYSVPGGRALRVSWTGTSALCLWKWPGAAFVCVEPWQGLPDPEGYDEDFRSKPGIVNLPAGASFTCSMTIALIDPEAT